MKSLNLSRKVGPLPLWAWGALGGVALYFFYLRQHTSTTATTDTQAVSDAQQAAADQLSAAQLGQPSVGGLGSSASDNLNSFDSDLLAFAQAQQDLTTLASSLGLVPAASTVPGSGGQVATPINITITSPSAEKSWGDYGQVVSSVPRVATTPLAGAHGPATKPTTNPGLFAKPPSIIKTIQESTPPPLKSTLNKIKPNVTLTER